MSESSVDLVVVGGGISGLMAAMAAKTDATRVLVVEPSNVLGGQGTAGGVAGFCGDTKNVNRLFAELIERLAAHGFINPWNPNDDRREYELEWCAFFLQEMALERGVEVLLHSRVIEARAEAGSVVELTVSTAGGLLRLRPRFVVDASGACAVPLLAGFPVVNEGANKQLPMSLYFTLWDSGRPVAPFLPPGLPAWRGDDEIPMTSLHVHDTGKVEVKMKVVGFDAADGESLSQAELAARRQMVALVYYLQTHGYKGRRFERHVLAGVSRRLGVREERRILGEHLLTDDEARRGTVFPDAVAVNTYHLDYHWPDRAQRAGTGITEMVEPYHVPLRSLIPRGARNLLVSGRGASAEQLALSSFRVMAVVQAMGFAAGRAVAQCLGSGTDLAGVDVARLQRTLEEDGQSLDLSVYGEYQRKLRLLREPVFGEAAGFASCHASTLVQLRNGRFLVAWFGGSAEGDPDTGIWLAERSQRAWSAPRRVAKVDDQPHWNPVLFRARDDTVHLFFRVGAHPRRWWTWTVTSADAGASWSEPRRLDASGGIAPGPVKNKPILLADGTWLAPNSVETAERWDVLVDRSRDGGASWEPGAPVPFDAAALRGGGAIQPALWESSPGHVHMLVRTTGGRIWRSDSEDAGRTWAPLHETPLPNPNAGFDVARLRDGTLALVYNHSDTPGVRTPLSLALSFDDGRTWPHRLDLETDEGEYSYPAVIPTAVGMAITWTWRRRGIAFWHGSIEQVTMQGTSFDMHTLCPVGYDARGEPVLPPRRNETV